MNPISFDLAHIWHPCSQMKDYETLPPIYIDHGQGVYLYDRDGKAYIDIISSWWCNLLGHCHPRLNAALKAQVDRLEHVIFANFTHEPVLNLVEKLLPLLPAGLTRFNFSDNGSAAVEAALKLAFQYQLQIGQGQRQTFLCLSDGYHGETIGALSVGTLDLYAHLYQPMLMQHTCQIPAPDCYRCPYGQNRQTCQAECAEAAARVFAEYGNQAVALILEPLLQGSAGMRIYPPLYLKKMRTLCDRYGVLLIADEIATGFGRTGRLFACDHTGIRPDIMCLSKGLTGGYLPMAITVTTEEIYAAFYANYREGKAFMHSHTYSGNPLAAAIAGTVIDVLHEDRILEQANALAPWLHQELCAAIGDHPHVGEIRQIGLINAIELVADRQTRQALPADRRTGYEIYKKALKKGLILRPLGDVLYFNPPLIIDRQTLSEAIGILRELLETHSF